MITNQMQKIDSENAPKPIGPYSQGIVAGDYLYTAGQIGIEPQTGNLVGGGIREQTTQVIDNLAAILEAGGASLDRVVKVEVFLIELDEVQIVNEIYAARFSHEPRPARQTVQVSRLPMGARVEISAVAYLGKTGGK
jgi:2-iminobutanoate/2-iminopropanoate deaminase